MFEAIFDAIIDGILYVVALICFYIEAALGSLLDLIYGMFRVFAGVDNVTYNGQKVNLLNVFFGNELIETVYRGMTLIAIVLLFVFALASVIRKLFDSTGEKVKTTYGMILTSMFKSILIMLLLTAVINVVILATSTVLGRIDYLFNNATELNDPSTIEFTDEEYSTMFRIMDTIACYSVNPSPSNRYNINSCFNSIRQDMQSLEASGVFKYNYVGAEDSWQYYLRQIYLSSDISMDVPIDIYNSSVASAIYFCMEEIENNSSFRPLSSYTRGSSVSGQDGELGTIIMLSATFNAAKSGGYNGNNASLTDNLRRPFYTGEKDIFDLDSVEDCFNIRFEYWNHFVCLVGLAVALMEFIKILLNCIARIFNMMVLYMTAPGFLAVSPLDDGGMFKQWIIAFSIQSVSVIGTYIVIRLMIMFIPIVMSNNLILFSSALKNMLAKTLFVIAVCFTAEKSNALIGGILAGNAGMQSIMAGDVGSGILNKGLSIGASVGKMAGGAALSVGKGVAGGVLGGAADVVGLSKVGHRLADARKSINESGLKGAYRNGFKSEATRDKLEAKKDREEARAARQSANEGSNALGQGNASSLAGVSQRMGVNPGEGGSAGGSSNKGGLGGSSGGGNNGSSGGGKGSGGNKGGSGGGGSIGGGNEGSGTFQRTGVNTSNLNQNNLGSSSGDDNPGNRGGGQFEDINAPYNPEPEPENNDNQNNQGGGDNPKEENKD